MNKRSSSDISGGAKTPPPKKQKGLPIGLNHFLAEQKPKIHLQHPTLSPDEAIMLLSGKWKVMTPAEKDPYRKLQLKETTQRKKEEKTALEILFEPKSEKLPDSPLNRYRGRLSEEQFTVFKTCFTEPCPNLFISGPAGTGKSHLIQCIKEYAKTIGKQIAITASTGTAASNLDGSTFHYFSSMGLGDKHVGYYLNAIDVKRKKKIQDCDILVLDEISMMKGDFLQKCDEVFGRIRKDYAPFGGMQVIFVGDFLQLPPVVPNKDKAQYVPLFAHDIWKRLGLKTFVLQKNHRQKEDLQFSEFLIKIRTGTITPEEFDTFKATTASAMGKVEPPSGVPRLFAVKNKVELFNKNELTKLTTAVHTFKAEVSGEKGPLDKLVESVPVEAEMHLKVGARVLLCRNINVDRGLYNGRRGIVVKFEKEKIYGPSKTGSEDDREVIDESPIAYPIVEFGPGDRSMIKPFSWEMRDTMNEDKVLAKVTQLPLILAWALTVHKMQGMTVDEAVVNGQEFFDYGHVYVALSRVRKASGL